MIATADIGTGGWVAISVAFACLIAFMLWSIYGNLSDPGPDDHHLA